MTTQPSIQTQIFRLLTRNPMTAEVLAVHLETECADVERELGLMFLGSKVERSFDTDPVYRLVSR